MTLKLEEKQQFNQWTVIKTISDDRNHNTKVLCRCICGKEKAVWKVHLVRGTSKSCGCNPKKGPEHRDWKGFGEISGDFWDSIKRGANGSKGRRKTLEFSISIEDAWNIFLKQNRKCVLSGVELNMNYGCRKYASRYGTEHTASLDRIDSSKGYTIDNIQWVHKDINMMKRTYNQSYFIEMCRKVANNVST